MLASRPLACWSSCLEHPSVLSQAPSSTLPSTLLTPHSLHSCLSIHWVSLLLTVPGLSGSLWVGCPTMCHQRNLSIPLKKIIVHCWVLDFLFPSMGCMLPEIKEYSWFISTSPGPSIISYKVSANGEMNLISHCVTKTKTNLYQLIPSQTGLRTESVQHELQCLFSLLLISPLLKHLHKNSNAA